MRKKHMLNLTTTAIKRSVIKEIYNFNPIKNLFQLANHNTLFIFDVDNVLITPSNEDDFRHPYRIKLWQSIMNKATKNRIDLLESSIFSSTKQVIVESQIIKIFKELSLHKIPTVALTAMGTGKFGMIQKKEEFRVKELNRLGFSFSALTPLQEEQEAPHLENTHIVLPHSICNGIPLLKSGIIFTAGVDKGTVLEYMFRKHNYFPEKIIFIDDYMNNITSLERLCIKLKINFYGFHYKAVSLIPLPIIKESLETLRFKILEQECKWLSYDKLQKNIKKI